MIASGPRPGKKGGPLPFADPIVEARQAIIQETRDQASAGMEAYPVRKIVREAHAVEQLASGCGDFELSSAACNAATSLAGLASTAPGGCADDIAAKLALLVFRMSRVVHDESSNGAINYELALSALLDVVILRDGPLALPAGAMDPVIDTHDAEHWHRRAGLLR